MRNLGELQKINLEMLLETKRICEKNNIKYFLIGGSLIGAVRHKGFIPWDDDLDIGMLREDYEKFLSVCKNELSNDYFLQNKDTDSNFGFCFTKMLKNNTLLIEKATVTSMCKKGIFIDIVPFDNVPNNFLLKILQALRIDVLKRLILLKTNYDISMGRRGIKRIIFVFFKWLCKFWSKEFLFKKIFTYIKKYNTKESKEVVYISGAYDYLKVCFNKKWVEETIYLDFENEKISCPKGYHNYLKKVYGDYMKFPSKNKRGNKHNIIKLEIN